MRGVGAWLRAMTIAVVTLAWPAIARADPPQWLRRDVVSRAIRRAVTRAGLDPETTRQMAVRARASGWMPDFSMRVVRGMGAIAAVNSQLATSTSADDSFAVDVRVQVQLERVVFHPSEVAMERLALHRTERRMALEQEIIDLLAALERIGDVEADGEASVARRLDYERTRARLEALIGATCESLLAR